MTVMSQPTIDLYSGISMRYIIVVICLFLLLFNIKVIDIFKILNQAQYNLNSDNDFWLMFVNSFEYQCISI